MDAETRKVLVKAKGLLAGGWCQGHYADDGRYCVVGAINAANGGAFDGNTLVHPEGGRYDEAMTVLGRAAGVFLTDWNDYPERTQAEVIALFDRVLAEHPEPEPVPPLLDAMGELLDGALERSERRSRVLA